MSATAVDRLFARFGFAFHNAFARTLRRPADFAAATAERSARLRGTDLAALVPGVRYRLRRDGLGLPQVGEAFALYCAALPTTPGAQALAAARWMVGGGIAELSGAEERRQALALAAFARALHGDSVHLLSTSDSAAQALADSLAQPLAALGMRVRCIARGMSAAARREAYAGAIVCAAHREIAHDYLRDGSRDRSRRDPLRSKLEALAGAQLAPLLPDGLRCALVEDADVAMLDDAQAPLVLAAEVDNASERLMYEQAIELARTLAPDADFTLDEVGAVHLATRAAQRLERLVAPLGGVWSARQRREHLVAAAVEALHVVRDVDYRVDSGRVLFPPTPNGAEPTAEEAELRMLVEVKEGCRLSARREVVARMSLPRFFARYRALAGACADASGLEGEFWSLYSIKTARAGTRPEAIGAAVRVFASATARRAAVVDAVRASASAGRAALVVLRTPAEAERLQAELKGAGADATISLFPALDAARLCGGRQPLSLVVAELPDAQRQLARVYRASGASSCQLMLSLEDEVIGLRLGRALAGARRLAAADSGELPPRIARWIGAAAQRAAERACRLLRSEMKARERTLDDLLAFSGRRD